MFATNLFLVCVVPIKEEKNVPGFVKLEMMIWSSSVQERIELGDEEVSFLGG